jgi:hypothetical protein
VTVSQDLKSCLLFEDRSRSKAFFLLAKFCTVSIEKHIITAKSLM